LCNNATILPTNPISTDDEDLYQSIEDGSGLFEDWTHLNRDKYNKNKTTIELNNTYLKNNSLTIASTADLSLPKNIMPINIFSIVFIVYKVDLYSIMI